MEIKTLHTDPNKEFSKLIEAKLDVFNWKNWEVSERLPLAIELKDDDGNLLGGLTARTFGNWLLIDNFWIDDNCRGQNLGSQMLQQLEAAAKVRGCTTALLDTLNFQAKPFYEKHGYQVQWVQEHYPKDGCKYFMTKEL